MNRFAVRLMTWGLRVLSLVIVFWWPAILRDPIYTPRHARLSGQELRLPISGSRVPDEERALAIFWNWENRSLVSTRWSLGPYRGIREPEGRLQTLIALLVVWIGGSLALSRWDSAASTTTGTARRGIAALFSTPMWQWFARRS
jgi:hypothetical protein